LRVLIADKFEQSGRDQLESLGCELVYRPSVHGDSLVEEIERVNPDVLVVRSTNVTGPMLNGSTLRLVVRAGAGFNNIDVGAASQRGIYVSNCPGKNSVAVAELAFGLILALDRRIPDNVFSLREGHWNKAAYSKARGLFGRTLGLVGLGRIGQEMIPRAKAFGLQVAAWSRSLTPDAAKDLGVEYKASLLELADSSDIVSLHLALNSKTRGLIGASFFEAMREGAYFINTARAELVDEDRLRDAMRTKGIRAGLDVFAGEPSTGAGEFSSEISDLVYGTHHIGASTDQAQEAIASETVRIVKTFKETGKVPNVVNLAMVTPSTCTLVVRHLDQPGVLASVLDAISEARINVQEMENVVFDGAQAAVARINLEKEPSSELRERIRASNANIFEVSLIRLDDRADAAG